MLRLLLDDPDNDVAAARALWSVEGDPEPLLSVFTRHLGNDTPAAYSALDGIGEVGSAAAALSPGLRAWIDRAETGRQHWIAEALWRITGDGETALPVLTAAWTAEPHTRRPIVTCLADMGAAAALLRTELRSVRRHTVRRISAYVDLYQTSIASDELLRLCAKTLAAIDRS
ncbi:hypothetical protein [Amycolatopsis sp. cmx-11-51]|uniref:hypothetical protein n=1 Tax=unclassified Amycolatopsis TaxID=2618356 RepID=UPI0039E34062